MIESNILNKSGERHKNGWLAKGKRTEKTNNLLVQNGKIGKRTSSEDISILLFESTSKESFNMCRPVLRSLKRFQLRQPIDERKILTSARNPKTKLMEYWYVNDSSQLIDTMKSPNKKATNGWDEMSNIFDIMKNHYPNDKKTAFLITKTVLTFVSNIMEATIKNLDPGESNINPLIEHHDDPTNPLFPNTAGQEPTT